MLSWVDASTAYAPHDLPACPALQANIQADVCVIGGGLAGLNAAMELAKRGADVVLIESRRVGGGASSRNGGQILPAFGGSMGHVRNVLGHEAALQIWDMGVEATNRVANQAASIPCEYVRDGAFTGAFHPRQLYGLEEAVKERAHYPGPGIKFIGRDNISRYVTTDAYLGGIYDPDAAHFDPAAFTAGIARAAVAAGVRMFEGTPAAAIETGRVTTPNGVVEAGWIIVAANAHGDSLSGRLACRFLPVRSHIVASEPLGADAETLMPTNACFGDANRVFDYYRRDAQGRIIFGGRVRVGEEEVVADTIRRMKRIFPGLDARVTHAWGGWVDVSRHRFPDIGMLTTNTLYLQGFSGHGTALAGFCGLLAAEKIMGDGARFDLMSRLPQGFMPNLPILRPLVTQAVIGSFDLMDRFGV